MTYSSAYGHMRRVSLLLAFALVPATGSSWGREGHQVIAILARHYRQSETARWVLDLPGSGSLEDASVWADEWRHSHSETGPWHCLDLQLAASRMDTVRQCRPEEVLV